MDLNTQKHNDLIFGLLKEKPTANIIEKVFKIKLHHTLFNYSSFDYYDDTQTYIFEIKNYRYSYNTYNTEIIGVNKGINNNAIFIFRHSNDDNEIYFIQFNNVLFKTFNTRNIFYRGNSVLCYDIPKQHITKIENNKVYELINNAEQREGIIKLIEKDKENYLLTKTKF